MAIIEVQFREETFFNILRAQIIRVEIPRAFFPELGPDRLVERVEPGLVSFADSLDPAAAGVRDGEVLFRIQFFLHHTSFAAARLAGSLKAPQTQRLDCVFWIKIAGAPPSTLAWSLAGATVAGQFRPVLPLGGSFPLGNVGVTVNDLQVAAGNGVVSLRLTTREQPIPAAVVNRLGGADWGSFIEGQVFADQLADSMNAAVRDVAEGSSDPVVEIDTFATGLWTNTIPLVPGLVNLPGPWQAFAQVGVVAVDAIPVINTDVPVRIMASTQITPNAVVGQLGLRTTISWHAHDFITAGSGGLITVVEDVVSKVMLSKLKPPPGQKEVGRGDRYVVYASSVALIQPKTELFVTSVQQAVIDETGLSATGSLTVYPAPSATFTLDAQRWASGVDCTSRSWKTEFHPAVVHVFCPDRFFVVKIRSSPVVVPPGSWIPTFGFTGVGTGVEVRDIEFTPPFPVKAAGTASSAFLDTNVGVRWVDLGVVPAKPAATKDPLHIQGDVISQCMAISDRWGMGVFNLAWLVDPPDHDLGLAPVREWAIAAVGIVDVERIELAAVGPRGERKLPSLPVENGGVFAQIVTDENETLQIRTPVRLLAAPPQVLQRWILPWMAVPVEQGTIPLAILDGALWVIERGKAAQIELPPSIFMRSALQTPKRIPAQDMPRLFAARFRRKLADCSGLPRTVGSGRVVATLHKGQILIGLAGPLSQATEAAAAPKHRADREDTQALPDLEIPAGV